MRRKKLWPGILIVAVVVLLCLGGAVCFVAVRYLDGHSEDTLLQAGADTDSSMNSAAADTSEENNTVVAAPSEEMETVYLLSAVYLDDDTDDRIEYTYDDAGNVITETYYFYYSDFDIGIEYAYDDTGNVITETYYLDSEFDCQVTYDDAGNILSVVCTDEDDEVLASLIYSYATDENSGDVTVIACDVDGEPDGWVSYDYDDSGDLVSERWIYVGDETSDWYNSAYTFAYTYDDSGNLLTGEASFLEENGCWSFYFEEYDYDDSGNLIYALSAEGYEDEDPEIWTIENVYDLDTGVLQSQKFDCNDNTYDNVVNCEYIELSVPVEQAESVRAVQKKQFQSLWGVATNYSCLFVRYFDRTWVLLDEFF